MTVRLILAVGLALVLFAAGARYRRYQSRARNDDGPVPRLPADLVATAARTWVVVTTPYCASCEPACRALRAADPDAAVVKVDAAERPDLVGAFRIRHAPTALLADSTGVVAARLVGSEAIAEYLHARV